MWCWLICRLSAGRFVSGGAKRRRVVPEPRLCSPVVRGARPDDRPTAGVVDIPSGPLGHRRGREVGALGRRSRRRTRMRLAHRQRRGTPLGRSTAGSRHRSARPSRGCRRGQEALFWRRGRYRTKQWCTSVVDVGGRQLIDIVPGKTAYSAEAWFRSQPVEWRDGIRWAVLDMSGPYRTA